MIFHIVTNSEYLSGACALIKSIRRHYSEEIYVSTDFNYLKLSRLNCRLQIFGSNFPVHNLKTLGLMLINTNDMVVQLDADMLMCNNINEALNKAINYDLIGCTDSRMYLNSRMKKRFHIEISNWKSINSGFIIFNKGIVKEFVPIWDSLIRDTMIRQSWSWKDQGAFNIALKTTQMDFGLLDRRKWNPCGFGDNLKFELRENNIFNKNINCYQMMLHFIGKNKWWLVKQSPTLQAYIHSYQ